MLNGYKAYIGAIGIFGTGLAMIANGITGDAVDPVKVYEGILACFGALGLFGVRNKQDR